MNRFPSAVALLAIAVITSGCGLLTGLRAQDESAPTAARNETPGVPATLPDPEDLRPPTPTAPSHTATTTESATDPESASTVSTPLTAALARIVVRPESDHGSYVRDEWAPHWGPGNSVSDGLNTRHEILKAQSSCPVEIYDGRVVSGCWVSVYDGIRTEDPSEFDVDHIVPIAEAHQSGGASWDRLRKRSFADDTKAFGGLLAVSASSNRDKSAQDPSQWMPPSAPSHCAYLLSWTRLKADWGLTMDDAEYSYIESRSSECTSSSGLLSMVP